MSDEFSRLIHSSFNRERIEGSLAHSRYAPGFPADAQVVRMASSLRLPFITWGVLGTLATGSLCFLFALVFWMDRLGGFVGELGRESPAAVQFAQNLDSRLSQLQLLGRDFLREDLTWKLRIKKVEMDDRIDKLNEFVSQYEQSATLPEKDALDMFSLAYRDWLAFQAQVQTYVLNGDLESAQALNHDRGEYLRIRMDASIKDLLLSARDDSEFRFQEVTNTYQKLRVFGWSFTLFLVALLAGVIVFAVIASRELRVLLKRFWWHLQELQYTISPPRGVRGAMPDRAKIIQQMEDFSRSLAALKSGLQDASESHRFSETLRDRIDLVMMRIEAMSASLPKEPGAFAENLPSRHQLTPLWSRFVTLRDEFLLQSSFVLGDSNLFEVFGQKRPEKKLETKNKELPPDDSEGSSRREAA